MVVKKKSSSDKALTKSGFIRSLPDRTPAKEVIAKAKEVGLDLKEKLVWTVQSEMRAEAKGEAKKAPKSSAPAVAAASNAAPVAPVRIKGKKAPKRKASTKVGMKPASNTKSSGAEQAMKALIVQLGTARADDLYRSVRKELDALIAG